MNGSIPKVLATGIGSLPHQRAEEAVELIFKYLPSLPFWPQLPSRSFKEGMIAQFSENIPFLKIGPKRTDFSISEDGMEEFYGQLIADNLDYFRISPEYAAGLYAFRQKLESSNLREVFFIKCQITGPFTFAGAIKDGRGMALLHDKVLMQAVTKAMVMKARWQIDFFKQFGKKIIMFIDEPYLACFGSAYTPINRNEVITVLSECASAIKSPDVLVGVHCCGNTDWSIFTEVAEISIISFDAFDYVERLILYAEDLKRFSERGGILCWGIVPAGSFTGWENKLLLLEKIKQATKALEKKGLDRELLVKNFFISPACGLGTLTSQKAEQIFILLSETVALINSELQ
ncbi:MAG: hypothetical protein NC923_07335 [Candidatus Omnitrophica bacterium]|nr:hypothetical protein [Candidatus Omnitrophota bacterium]